MNDSLRHADLIDDRADLFGCFQTFMVIDEPRPQNSPNGCQVIHVHDDFV